MACSERQSETSERRGPQSGDVAQELNRCGVSDKVANTTTEARTEQVLRRAGR